MTVQWNEANRCLRGRLRLLGSLVIAPLPQRPKEVVVFDFPAMIDLYFCSRAIGLRMDWKQYIIVHFTFSNILVPIQSGFWIDVKEK